MRREMLAFVMMSLVFVSIFVPCVPKLKASGDEAKLRVSYIVQPDRINVPHDRVEGYGYNIWGFQNDNVNFSVYLTNSGNGTAENVTARLSVPEGLGFNLTGCQANYGNIESQSIAIGNFSFTTSNAILGLHSFALNISFWDSCGEHDDQTNLIAKILDIGISNVLHSEYLSPFQNETETKPFLTRTDSVLLGYYAVFASNDRDSFDVIIRNGGTELIENLTLAVVPPSGVGITAEVQRLVTLNVTRDLWNIGEERTFYIDVTTCGVFVGLYNLTAEIEYVRANVSHTTQAMLPIGVYNATIMSSVNISHQDELTKSFIISSEMEIDTPHGDRIGISTSNFDLTEVAVPTMPFAINSTIEDIIRREFPAYFNSSKLSHNKSAWTKSRLLNATFGEMNTTGKAILNDFGNAAGSIVGWHLSGAITGKLLEDHGFNALVDLASETAAKQSGAYYGRLVLHEALNNTLFLNEYLRLFGMIDKIEVPFKLISELVEILVPLDLTMALNGLPINWTQVSDENSTFTRDSPGWGNIVVDNLPLSLTLELSQLREQYNLINLSENFRITILLKSSNAVHYHVLGGSDVNHYEVFNRSLTINIKDNVTLNIDTLGRSNYKAISLVEWGNIRGVSESITFNVIDPFPPEPKLNNVMDSLSEADFQSMKDKTYFSREIDLFAEVGASSTVKTVIFEKSILEYDPQCNLTLTSAKYNSTSNSTSLSFEILSKKTKLATLNITTFYLESYAKREAKVKVEEKIMIVNLTEDVPYLLSVEVSGKYGYDFKEIVGGISGSPLAFIAWIGLAAGVVTIAEKIGGIVFGWCRDESTILHGGKRPGDVSHSVDVGIVYALEWNILFQAKGPLDFWRTYKFRVQVTGSPEVESEQFTGGSRIIPWSVHFAESTGIKTVTINVKVLKYWPEMILLGSPVVKVAAHWELDDEKNEQMKVSETNPLAVTDIVPNPKEVEHGKLTKVTVEVKFSKRKDSNPGMRIETGSSMHITSANLIAEDSGVNPKFNLPQVIKEPKNEFEKLELKYDVSHRDDAKKHVKGGGPITLNLGTEVKGKAKTMYDGKPYESAEISSRLDSSYICKAHDVGIKDLKTKSVIITVENYGDFKESFNVTVYVIGRMFGKEPVVLEILESKTLSFEWTPPEYGTYVIRAEAPLESDIDPTDNIREIEVTIGPAIDVFTDRGGEGPIGSTPFGWSDAYGPQEEVCVYAKVTYNEEPVENKPVAFEMTDPNGTSIDYRSASTNASGIATVCFRIPWEGSNAEDLFGDWSIIGTVDIAETTVNDTVKFRFGYIIEITQAKTVDNHGNPKTTFAKGEHIYFNLTIQNIAFTSKKATITIVAYDECSVPIGLVILQDWVIGPGSTEISIIGLQIPNWAYVGIATIYANAYTDLPTQGGTPTCPEKTTTFIITKT